MSAPFLAEIRIFGFNFAPRGWALCNGQLLPISQNTALFSLIGTFYGGNGQSNFALPNMQGNFPMHWGNGPGLSQHVVGETGGEPVHSLSVAEIPNHNHLVQAPPESTPVQSPSAGFLGTSAAKPYDTGTPNAGLAPDSAGITGSSIAHNNLPPYVAVNFCIAMQGIFPARN
ncbi:MAG TPA: tail fiber protein [Usitatibacter sp.]|jgi:microcystin-dependent protein|nr:tail fiber protein [Usitatibacter sp.]